MNFYVNAPKSCRRDQLSSCIACIACTFPERITRCFVWFQKKKSKGEELEDYEDQFEEKIELKKDWTWTDEDASSDEDRQEFEEGREDRWKECISVCKVIYKLLFLRKNNTTPEFLFTVEVLSGKNIRNRLSNLLVNTITDGTLVKALTGSCLACSVNMETTFDSDRGKLNFFFSRHLHLFRSAQMVLQGFDLEFFFSSWKECVCSSCLELLKSKTNIRQGSFFLDLPLWLISRFFVAVM